MTAERWSVDRLQEYVGALGRSPKRDPLDRPTKPKQSATPGDIASTGDAAAVAQSESESTAGTSAARHATPPPLFTKKAGRFTVHVDRARACSDAAARAALADAVRRLTAELGI